MKFATLFALVASASALRLGQTQKPSLRQLLKIKDDGLECPTQEQFNEIAAWVTHELTTGDKTITAQEAEDGAMAFAEKHGIKVTKKMKKQAKEAFEQVDTNSNGELDLAEVEAVWKKHGDAMMEHCGLEYDE